MYISHSVMEGQRHNNPLNPRCFCLQRPKRDGTSGECLTHIIVQVAKALGGSFKLGTLAPRTVREMTQLPKETQKNGDTNKSKRTNMFCGLIAHYSSHVDNIIWLRTSFYYFFHLFIVLQQLQECRIFQKNLRCRNTFNSLLYRALQKK